MASRFSILTTVSLLICLQLQTIYAEDKCKFCSSEGSAPHDNRINLTEPHCPGPFHDLTKVELLKLRTFLVENDETKVKNSSIPDMSSSYIVTADIMVDKEYVYKNHQGGHYVRRAYVMLQRGDKTPAVVEEWICAPLPRVKKCHLLNRPGGTNPAPFSVRPFTALEYVTLLTKFTPLIDNKLGKLLLESYNVSSFREMKPMIVPVASGFTGKIEERQIWLIGAFYTPAKGQYAIDLDILVECSSSDPSQWSVKKLRYARTLYDDLDSLQAAYNNNTATIPKVTFFKPCNARYEFSLLNPGQFSRPERPQRAPVQVEPDGKRYIVKNRKVHYLDWSFYFRMSSIHGPALYEAKFNNSLIAFEISLQEIVSLYTGLNSWSTAQFFVGSYIFGNTVKNIIPGADCPEYATIINQTSFDPLSDKLKEVDGAFCLFENNNGYPLRRKAGYDDHDGNFYDGLQDSALTLRSILSLGNSDVVIDFIFHQNGAVETQARVSGYLMMDTYKPAHGDLFGLRIDKHIAMPHNYLFNFKFDLDIDGRENDFSSYDFTPQEKPLAHDKCTTSVHNTIVRHYFENEALGFYDFNVTNPQYLVVSNPNKKVVQDVSRGYRFKFSGMHSHLLTEEYKNEPAMSWARHQLFATVYKPDESTSSSLYAMFDSEKPVVDFSKFLADKESLRHKDLVLWVTGSIFQLPRKEDFPYLSTVGKELNFVLSPFNFFPECPSLSSRDALFVGVDTKTGKKTPRLRRYHNSNSQCVLPKTPLEDFIIKKPGFVIAPKTL